jgi:cell division protein FtsQ
MAPAAANKKKRAINWAILIKYTLIFALATSVLAGGIYAAQQVEQFIISDPRFFLSGPPDYGLESPNLELHGIRYSSRARILNVFSRDFGRSLFLLPLADRRKALLNVSWVRDAAIVRLWPNRVAVEIAEREPAAFIDLKVDSMNRWALIDAEGIILEPPPRAPFKLPVISGVRAEEAQSMRGTRVRRMQRMMAELGALGDKVSEIDVADLDNLRITEQIGGNSIVLMLGDSHFASRLQNFLDHYPDIHRKMPNAGTFDLRLDDRITAVGGANAG